MRRVKQKSRPAGPDGKGRGRRSREGLRRHGGWWQLAYFLASVAFGVASFFGVFFEDGDFAVSPVWTDPCWM